MKNLFLSRSNSDWKNGVLDILLALIPPVGIMVLLYLSKPFTKMRYLLVVAGSLYLLLLLYHLRTA